jgi:hypothetical protein
MAQGQGAAARAIALAAAALVLVQAALVYGQPSRIWYSSLGISLPERADRMEKISELIRQTPGDVLSEDNWLVLRNGKRVIYDDPAGMAALARSGKWDESILLQEIGGRAFPMVVLDYDITDLAFTYRWSDAALRALRDNYDLLYADVRFIHIPKPVEVEPLAQVDCRAAGGPGLQGYTFRPTEARPGNVFGLGLYWQRDGTTEVDGNIKVSARLVDEAGGVRWQADWPPGETAGKAWSAAWAPGQTIVDTVQVPLSYDIPYGKYRLDLVGYTLNAEGNLAPVEFDCTFPPDIGAAGGLRLAEFQLVERR